MNGKHIVVFITVDSEDQAKRISDVLLQKKLIACVNIVRDIRSFFWWKGQVDSCSELLMIMKSRGELLDNIVDEVRRHHNYEVPEIVAMPIVGGNSLYLQWIDESVETHRQGDAD
jgi:periplasmic divalent cation tolerance protein